MTLISLFHPFEDRAASLLPQAFETVDDGSHDVAHLARVWRNVCALSAKEGGDQDILIAATLLHDCVDVPKDSSLRSQASCLAADKARTILRDRDWAAGKLDEIAHAIEAHSFSAGIPPGTLEAKILQDADRLDAIGHIGIARCFYVSGRLGRAIYDPQDPLAETRELDDLAFALDHFETKLMTLAGTFQTSTGAQLAAHRHETLKTFRDGLMDEVRGHHLPDQ